MKNRIFIIAIILGILSAMPAVGDSVYYQSYDVFDQQGNFSHCSSYPVSDPREDQFVITFSEEDPSLRGLSLTDGTTILPARYRIIESALSFRYYDIATQKYGFFDKASGFLQPPVYDFCWDMSTDDVQAPVLVGLDDKYGYLDRSNGNICIPLHYPAYCLYSNFFNGYALIIEDVETEKIVLIDKNDQAVSFPEGIMPESYVQDNGLLIVSAQDSNNNTIYGLSNTQGEIVLIPQYTWIEPFQYGYASVYLDGKWGHINEQGDVIVAPQFELFLDGWYDGAGYFFNAEGVAELTLDDGSCIKIDIHGQPVQ